MMPQPDSAPDYLQRRVPTPLNILLRRNGLTLFVQSNDPRLLEMLGGEEVTRPAPPLFVCTIVADSEAPGDSWAPPKMLADGNLTCVTFGQHAWFAVDFAESTVTGFVPGSLASDRLRLYAEAIWSLLVQSSTLS